MKFCKHLMELTLQFKVIEDAIFWSSELVRVCVNFHKGTTLGELEVLLSTLVEE